MRLIDGDALKEKLQEQQKYGSTADSRGRAKAIIEVIHAPAIEAEPVNRWISVEDELPKDSEKVLCLTVGNFYEILCKIIDGWCCPLTSQEFYTDFVKYWQPLPKLPEKNKKEA